MPPPKTFGERIADALVEDGLLSSRQIEELLEQQKKEGTRLLKLILEKSYVSEHDMAVSMGRVLNTPPINLARSFPAETCQRWCVLPFDKMSKSIFVATANPFNQQAAKELAEATANRLLFYLVPPGELVQNVRKAFR